MLSMETYYGHVKTPNDAIILFEACRVSTLPRVQRRLSEKERQQIRSGSVFVWDEREAGMRRWTDGKSWSASRVSGSFLTYREMEGKRGGGSNLTSPAMGSVNSGRDQMDLGDAPDGYRYKADGLVKQSFSITTNQGHHLHLISYFARGDPSAATLRCPTSDPALRHIHPEKGMYPESTTHDGQMMPAVTRSPMVESPFQSSPSYGPSHSYMRHPPPNFTWPPSPHHTPPNMSAQFPPGYYPYPIPGPNGMPLWPHPAYFASASQHVLPATATAAAAAVAGQTAFDRAPPPLRATGGPPPPPPAPAQPYPQHRQPAYSAPSGHTSLQSHISNAASTSPTLKIPPIDHKRSYEAIGGGSHQQHPSDSQTQTQTPPTSAHERSNPASQHDSPQQSENRLTNSNGFLSPQKYSPQSDSSLRNSAQRDLPPPPPPSRSKNIPSINSLINKSPSQSPPQLSQSASLYGNYTNGYRNVLSSVGATSSHSDPMRNSDKRMSDVPDKPGVPQQPGYGEDVNALRKLDRAFAP